MLVGMPFSGKTTALNTLQKALTDLAQEGSHPLLDAAQLLEMVDQWH